MTINLEMLSPIMEDRIRINVHNFGGKLTIYFHGGVLLSLDVEELINFRGLSMPYCHIQAILDFARVINNCKHTYKIAGIMQHDTICIGRK
jgi:hypothetical protein